MGQIDYSKEPHSDIAFIDMKSFYASVECVKRGLHPLTASLCVMSRSDNYDIKATKKRDNLERAIDHIIEIASDISLFKKQLLLWKAQE